MKIKIERLGMNGEGVGKLTEGNYKDKVCFVPFALPEEVAEIQIIKDKKKFALAETLEISSKSRHRVIPKCPYFGVCGGCDLQHMDKHLQKLFKTNYVQDLLKKELRQDIFVHDVMRLNDYAYRNKMVFPVTYFNKLTIGMFERESHNIAKIGKCILAEDLINECLEVTRDYFKESNLLGYDFKNKNGDIKYLVVRNAYKKLLVTIVATREIKLTEYYNVLENHFKDVGLSLIVSDSDDEILSGKYKHIAGIQKLELDDFGIKYALDNRGFLQVNNEIKKELYKKILNNVKSEDKIIDAYSGAGLLSAILARKCKQVVAIEINESACNSAVKLAKENSIKNIQFICGDVKDYIQSAIDNLGDCVVILDPPRSGCDREILELLNKYSYAMHDKKKPINKAINKVIYVSCNPATLARDLKILSSNFEIVYVQPMDMFPQTKHVETLVVLEKK